MFEDPSAMLDCTTEYFSHGYADDSDRVRAAAELYAHLRDFIAWHLERRATVAVDVVEVGPARELDTLATIASLIPPSFDALDQIAEGACGVIERRLLPQVGDPEQRRLLHEAHDQFSLRDKLDESSSIAVPALLTALDRGARKLIQASTVPPAAVSEPPSPEGR
ncbi:hypothetical protein HUO13_17630 [Saccharopolyspora erythraea]|uniref:hypothetical protein n=1 Tax=Saccharopolyspora erythraea TaxID=1836 RepID=UPI001BA82ABF|nr:hypothetical protein [Saccharopolyspora erythraea]QUH02380.1 hypothetical protein HUO13_17630 [Saccharopolyspora erythraea]